LIFSSLSCRTYVLPISPPRFDHPTGTWCRARL
jgi:hypothetical protein